MLEQLSTLGWPMALALAAAGLIIGFSKTSFGGLGALAVALVALGMPARESTATVLLLLLVGDAVAITLYRRDVHWRVLGQLLPSVIPGLLLGAWFINVVDDALMRRSIAVILLAMLGLRLLQARRPESSSPTHWAFTVGAGIAAGFTTMTANSAAPVMALYLLAKRFDKKRFVSTNAWFFVTVNLCKVPLTASLGLFTPYVLWVALAFAPAVLIGTFIGRRVLGRVSQRQFETATTVVTAFACLLLLLR